MKNFIHHNIPTIKQINSDKGRCYQTPTGENYPSVTTVVGLHSAQSIQKWRARVGEGEANKISRRASKRGTSIHSLCEEYLKGNAPTADMFDQEVFSSITPHLDCIDDIHCLESKLFSHHLQVAGTCDVIAKYKGKLSVIDFKTSLKPKRHEWVHGYFAQTSAYSFMAWELLKLQVPNLVVIIGIDGHEAQVFQEPTVPWLKQFKIMRENFRTIKGY